MRRAIVLPALAAGGGAGLFLLRLGQLAAAYDGQTQLFTPGHPATLALVAAAAALAGLFLRLTRGMKGGDDFLPAYRCPAAPSMALAAAAAFLFPAAGVLGLLEGLDALADWRMRSAALQAMGASPLPAAYPVALLLGAVLCIPAGLAVLLLGRAAFKGELPPACSLTACCPALAGLARVFALHLEHGSDPQLLRYGFSLLALGLMTVAAYDAAGALFTRPHPRRAAFCALLGAALGVMTLADRPGRADTLLIAAFVLFSLWHAAVLLYPGGAAADPERPETED